MTRGESLRVIYLVCVCARKHCRVVESQKKCRDFVVKFLSLLWSLVYQGTVLFV